MNEYFVKIAFPIASAEVLHFFIELFARSNDLGFRNLLVVLVICLRSGEFGFSCLWAEFTQSPCEDQ